MNIDLLSIAKECAEAYSTNLNPLPELRRRLGDVHFEYANPSNEWYMNDRRATDSDAESIYFFNTLVVLLKPNEYVRVFFQGNSAYGEIPV